MPEARECYRSSAITDPYVLEIFASSVANGTTPLLQISDKDILALCLGNLVEELLRYALGVYNMAAHIHACY